MKKIRLLYLTPHLSTGGMPQFVLKRIESLQKHKDQLDIFLVEYSLFSDTYVVQRNKIIELLDVGHFFTLGGTTETERKKELLSILKDLKIDIIHTEEIPEAFESFNRIPLDILNELYDNNREWKVVETCHNVWFNPNNKKFHPDAYSFVTPYHFQTFISENSFKELHLYPYEDKVKPILDDLKIYYDDHRIPLIQKITERERLGFDLFKTHILNVGLWTEGKNQKEGIEVARLLQDSHPDLHFHFIGNQAPNFENYWGSIMNDLPSNVTVWGERNDVDSFMMASDVLMFNSTWECNPLVVREAINYGLKILTRNLPQYMGMFDKYITSIENDDYQSISNQLINLVNDNHTYKIEEQKDFGDQLLTFYKEVLSIDKVENKKLKKDLPQNVDLLCNHF